MQPSKMGQKSVKSNFNFCDWLYTLCTKLPFTTSPIEIGQLVLKIGAVEDCKKQRNHLLCLAIS